MANYLFSRNNYVVVKEEIGIIPFKTYEMAPELGLMYIAIKIQRPRLNARLRLAETPSILIYSRMSKMFIF